MGTIIDRFAMLLGDRYRHRLEAEPEVSPEGLLLHFDTGLTLEVKASSQGECAYAWRWSEPDWAMETDIRGLDLASFCAQNGHSVSSLGGNLSEPTLSSWPDLLAVLDALFRPVGQATARQ